MCVTQERASADVYRSDLGAIHELRAIHELAHVQVSTDQIFDGNNPVYSESSEALPVNSYGATKLMFEQELKV